MPEMLNIRTGDVRAQLAKMDEQSVHCVVTSPPYWGLRDYGTKAQVWGGDPDCAHEWQTARYYVEGGGGAGSSKEAFSKPGEENAKRIKDARWRQDDTCYECSAWRGQLGLEPTIEMFVEHMVDVFAGVWRVLRDDGTLWLNMGDCYAGSWSGTSMRPEGGTQRPGGPGMQPLDNRYAARRGEVPAGLKAKDLVGQPWRLAFALQAAGWYLRSDIIWAKPNPMPESCRDRPTKSHEYIFLLTKQPRYFFDQEAVRERGTTPPAQLEGRVARAKAAPTRGDPATVSAFENWKGEGRSFDGTRNIRSVWPIATQPFPEAHFATFPEALPERCILAGTSEKGCCPECGAPWVRVTEKARTDSPRRHGDTEDARRIRLSNRKAGKTRNCKHPRDDQKSASGRVAGNVARAREAGGEHDNPFAGTKTTGWRPSCEHPRGDQEPANGLATEVTEDTERGGRLDYDTAARPNRVPSSVTSVTSVAEPLAVPCTVLDPFAGACTTGLVAVRLGRRFVGIELNRDYAEMGRDRIQAALPLLI